MKCPKCENPYECPCKECVNRRGSTTWEFLNGDSEKCGQCGFTQQMGAWLDEEYKQYKETPKELI